VNGLVQIGQDVETTARCKAIKFDLEQNIPGFKNKPITFG
jgi:formyltetrahydrofolate hydrolase